MSNVSPLEDFPQNLPFGGPYDLFFRHCVWLPLVLRTILLPVPILLVWNVHRNNLTWLLRLIWNDLPGGRKLTVAMVYGLVLPIILGTGVRAMGSFGWASWSVTPPWAAALFLAGLAWFWLWDLSRIFRVIRLLRAVRRTKKKLAVARWGIEKAQKIAGFLKVHTEVVENAGRFQKAEVFIFERARSLGKIPVNRMLAKIEKRVRSARVRIIVSGLFFQLAPAVLLYALVLLDALLRNVH